MKATLRRLSSTLAILLIVPLSSAFFPARALADGYQPGQTAAISTYAPYFTCTHIVRPGETLSRLAVRYHTTVYALAQANQLRNPNFIWSGMALLVPCAVTRYPPSCISATYVVRPGDNLFRIGLRFGVSPYTIAAFNGVRNPNLIFVGMRLAIPCASKYASPAQPAPAPGYPPAQPSPLPNYPSPQPSPSPGYPPTQPSPTPPPTTGQVTIVMQNIAFNPQTITIHVGQTVVWRNDDAVPHTTTSGSCSGNTCTPTPGWDSGTLNTGQSFSHMFNTAGTFSYYCRIHGAAMQGTVVVMP
jgi:plastocyanin/LysM repeat protein